MLTKDKMDCEQLENEDFWNIIGSYFKNKHLEQLVRHQIESYNDFVCRQIPDTINMFNPVRICSEHDYDKESGQYKLEIFITFDNFGIYRPQIHENNGATKIMFPQEARMRNFTYASTMSMDMKIKYVVRSGNNLENIQTLYKSLPKVLIGKLPIMLRSNICILSNYKHMTNEETGECKMDPGGYFIINGSEKTCLGQERAAENIIYCFDVSKNNTKWSHIAEIKSVPDWKSISPKQISVMSSLKNNGFGSSISIQIPRMKVPIPIFILFRALNINSDKKICEIILLDLDKNKNYLNNLKASIVEANNHTDYESCIKYITSQVIYTPMNMDKEQGTLKKKEFALEVLNNDLFPHCHNITEKIYFLGHIIFKLIKCSLKQIPCDDRDCYINKRIDTTGILLNNLFRNYFNKLVKDMQKQVIREINNGSWKSNEDYYNIINLTNIYKIVKSTTIENGIKRALATGDFGIKQNTTNKVGVAQVLNRLTYISSLSHLRRCNTPIDKSGKLIPPRKLHNSTWGFLCPAETPEGQSIGVVKNISYLATITINSNSKPLEEYIENHIVKLNYNENFYDRVKVFLNGAWMGITDNPIELYSSLKEKKAKGIMNIYTSIIFDYKNMEIRICNDAGRLVRPLLKVENNKLLLTKEICNRVKNGDISWDDLFTDILLEKSVLEYVDPLEQNNSLVSLNSKQLSNMSNFIYKYTHCEIHPSTIFGILASCIPFPEHNQSPRLTYQCAMGKQAMGVYVTNYNNRMDKTAYVHVYGMRPLVDTRVMNLINLNTIPSGAQVIVAIATYTGYNQEDSILFNKGSLDRGLFQAVIYHTEKDEDKKIQGDQEIRCKPDPSKTKAMKFGNYNKVNNNGVIPENTLVEDRDIIISKVLPIKDNKNDHTKLIKYEDQSRTYRTKEDVYIDKNYIERNGDGYNFCKVRVRCLRKPVIGDKFSSRHGQKGTIGNIIPEENMPFTEEGLRPDIIINPHAIPSRMTIGQLKETLLGKVLLQLGLFGDGTSFGQYDIKNICKELQDLGYESNGNEVLYDGLNGEQLKANIFIGPAFYQRLKHMVNDKQHSRSVGPMVSLTRQPAEGRSKDGGLRFGEMEKDAIVAHGASAFNKERLLDASDKFDVHVCKKCGLIASYNDTKHIHFCKTCENRTHFALVKLPYSCKLLFQELISMNIAPRILT
jgi:DNA-directed RNA polymerase II subunit RPB2